MMSELKTLIEELDEYTKDLESFGQITMGVLRRVKGSLEKISRESSNLVTPGADLTLGVIRLLEDFHIGDLAVFRYDIEADSFRVFADCAGAFEWDGEPDAEEITMENLALFVDTAVTVRTLRDAAPPIQRDLFDSCLGDLFAARVRKMRPAGNAYMYYPPALHALFDAVGPERGPQRQSVVDTLGNIVDGRDAEAPNV